MPRRPAGEAGLDSEPRGTGGGRHRPTHQHGYLAVGQTHLHGSPTRGGNEVRRLLPQDLFVLVVYPEVGGGTKDDLGRCLNARVTCYRHNGRASAPFVLEECPEEGALPLRTLFQQLPFDGAGGFTDQSHHRRISGRAQAGEIDDAFDPAADRIAYRCARADIRV